MAKAWVSAGLNLDQDRRELPGYSVPEAARYLRIPQTTLRYWVLGRSYPIEGGQAFAEPLIILADKGRRLLSFLNLVEAHVLAAIRHHDISLQKIRRALDYLERHFPSKHPLADQRFETDGLHIFVQQFGALINLSLDGQLEMRNMIEIHLRRIEHDESGLAARLYPFTRDHQPEAPKTILIDPHIAFGRPVLAGTGIPTAIIAERCKAGESIEELAGDYRRDPFEILEAIRWELPETKAA